MHIDSNLSLFFFFFCFHLLVRLEPINRFVGQLQIGERNWSREKLELLERFGQERAQWEQRLREATQQELVG